MVLFSFPTAYHRYREAVCGICLPLHTAHPEKDEGLPRSPERISMPLNGSRRPHAFMKASFAANLLRNSAYLLLPLRAVSSSVNTFCRNPRRTLPCRPILETSMMSIPTIVTPC